MNKKIKLLLVLVLIGAITSVSYGSDIFGAAGAGMPISPSWGAVDANIVPDTDGAYDLGSATLGFDEVHFSDGTDRFYMYVSGANTGAIVAGTSDASDDQVLTLTGGGGTSTSRGGNIQAFGNEHATQGGKIKINSGAVSTANIDIDPGHASATIRLMNAGTATASVDADSINPATDGVETLGDATKGWGEIHTSNGSINSVFDEDSIGTTTASNFQLKYNGATTLIVDDTSLRPATTGVETLGKASNTFSGVYTGNSAGTVETLYSAFSIGTTAAGATNFTLNYGGAATATVRAASFDPGTNNVETLGLSTQVWKTAFVNQLNIGDDPELTIATGAVTKAKGNHVVDTEADASTDDLNTISGGVAGDMLVLRAANSARDVVVKDGTGNILTAGDFTMDNVEDAMMLIYDGTNWVELCRSNNGA